MSDLPQPPTPPGPTGGGSFCAECGTSLAPGTEFCGNCGAAQPRSAAPAAGAPSSGDAPGGGGSTWAGVAPVVENPAGAPSGPPPAAPGAGPTPPGPPPGAGGPTPPGAPPKKGKGALIVIAVLVVAALGIGGFLLVGGGDDDESASDDTTTTTEDEDEDEETTTTDGSDDTTTTTSVDDTTTTEVVIDDPLAGIEFVAITDDSGRLIVEVPDDWVDVSTAPLNADNRPTIQASTDLAAFRSGFEPPGVSFSLLSTAPADFDQALDFLASSVNLPNACTSAGKQDYTDGVFTGRLEVWQNCADIGTTLVLVVGSRADGLTVEINVQLPEGEPVEIADQIANTFNIVD